VRLYRLYLDTPHSALFAECFVPVKDGIFSTRGWSGSANSPPGAVL
jgi:hypothetical protein